ncbi:MAG: protein-glutamate O-methyltransferase CheR [Actinomycetia bacterium]|nr:protein-glutamate O-methyltransferase CheR [Actinomycetes bacterium]
MEGRQADAVNRGNLTRLLEKVRTERGLDMAQYRPRYVERRIAARLRTLNLRTYRQYAAYLDGHPEEYAKLFDTLTINVTQFFRDPTVFELFREDIVRDMLAEKAARRQHMIRVWSAGCATGQEPYSLAMAFLSAMGPTSHDFLLTILGTDLDRNALNVAKRAEYDISLIDQIPLADRNRYVEVYGDHFKIKPEVARLCKFDYFNLFEDKPIHAVDVIFCRNVFIYFNRDEQERILHAFWSALARGGYLVLGRTERIGSLGEHGFELVSGRERIYRKSLELL